MSRLKGADLGVSLPTGTMNYRGPWSSATTYALGDIALSNGTLIRANKATGPVPAQAPYTGSSSAVSTTAATTGSITLPASTLVGDTILLAITPGGGANPTVTTPTGWTLVQSIAVSGAHTLYVYSKVATAGDIGATVTFTMSGSAGYSAQARSYTSAGGVDASASATGTNGTPFTPMSPPAVTATVNGDTLVAFFTMWTSNSAWNPALAAGGSHPLVTGAGPNSAASSVIGSEEFVGFGTGAVTATGGQFNDPSSYLAGVVGISVLLKPSGSPVPTSADWDTLVTIPAGTLNSRGAWSATPALPYAANDVVSDGGLFWTASVAPPAGAGSEPVLGTTYIPSPVDVGHATIAGASGLSGWKSFEQAFTTGGSSQVVTAVQLTWLTTPTAGTFRVGIATAPGGSDTAVTWLGATPSVQSAPGAAGTFTFALPAALTLSASTTYYLVFQALTGGPADNLPGGSAAPTSTGCIASVGALQMNPTIGGAWGSNSWHVQFTLINGAPALYWQPLGAIQESVNTVAASGAAVTLPDVTVATMHRVTLTAATPAITLPTPGAGKSFTVELVQDATGGRAPTWATPSGAIRWPGGTAPTITAAANAIDVITFACIGGTNWYGFVAGQAFA